MWTGFLHLRLGTSGRLFEHGSEISGTLMCVSEFCKFCAFESHTLSRSIKYFPFILSTSMSFMKICSGNVVLMSINKISFKDLL